MNLLEAIAHRHSVRKYTDQALPGELVSVLQERIAAVNVRGGLHIQLVLDEPKAFSSGLLRYGAFSGVKNYLVLAAGEGKDEAVGYYGEELVLLAQTCGLNSCWVGLTYKKIPGTFILGEGEKVYCVISLGYGAGNGVQHPLREVERFYEIPAGTQAPPWFLDGIRAAVLAPTAVNQQKFRFILLDDKKVRAIPGSSLAGYTGIDLGIAKYHFEIGAGKENFEWEASR
ncbi:MAG: nitroreductase [Bacteroidales bacterium]|nr:nitroreductase [Bacteroidales bacterium]